MGPAGRRFPSPHPFHKLSKHKAICDKPDSPSEGKVIQYQEISIRRRDRKGAGPLLSLPWPPCTNSHGFRQF